MKSALIVCDDLATMAERVRSLRDSGFEISVCEGPASHECPRLWAQPCVLRDSADVALVEITSAREGAIEDAERLCTSELGIHGTVVVTGSTTEQPGAVALHPPFGDSDLVLAAAFAYVEAAASAK